MESEKGDWCSLLSFSKMAPLNLRLLFLPSASLPQFNPRRIPLYLPESRKNLFVRTASSSFSTLSPFPISSLQFRPRVSISGAEKHAQKEEEEDSGGISVEYEDLGAEGEIFRKTLRLVECAMFASISGLAYFLSNSLAIEVSYLFLLHFSLSRQYRLCRLLIFLCFFL